MADTLTDLVARLRAAQPALADVPDDVLTAEVLTQLQARGGPSVGDALGDAGGAPTFRTTNEKDAGGVAVVRDAPPLGFLAPYLEHGMDLLRGVTGLGDQGPAGPTWTNAGQLLAAVPVVAGVKRAATVAREGLPAVEEALQGIRAFHGSPHDFDAFSTAKIGTGEGAQAYGHGLYFAEKEGTAGYYKQAGVMDPRDAMSLVIERAKGYGGDDTQLRNVLKSSLYRDKALAQFGDSDAIVNDLVRVVRGQEPGGTVSNEALSAYRRIDKAVGDLPKGKMYEVQIKADPAHFLDWDAPLSAQTPQVQQAMQQMRDAGVLGDETGAATTGAELLRSKSVLAPEHNLNRFGVPGIKYLDQGSRAAGEGSRNYVVFDDKLIDILRKYGLVPPLAAAAAGRLVPDHTRE